MKKKMKLEAGQMQARFQPQSFNEEARTVEVVFTTGATVKRSSFFRGPFFEELSTKRGAINLERLNNGAPVLDNHNNNSLNDTLGVVEKASVKDGVGSATIRFSEREEVQGLIRDIQSGVIRNISMGYSIDKVRDVTKKGDEIPTFRVEKATPFELSFVNTPADHKAQVRNQENTQSYDCEIVGQKEDDMNEKEIAALIALARSLNVENVESFEKRFSEEEKTFDQWDEEIRSLEVKEEEEVPAPTEEPAPTEIPVDLDAERSLLIEQGKQDEADRRDGIRSLCKKFDLESEFVSSLVSGKRSIDEARSDVIEHLAKKDEERKTNNLNVEVNMDNAEKRKIAAVSAIDHQFGSRSELVDGAREFCGSNIIDTAKRFMESEGLDVRNLSNHEIAKLALGQSVMDNGKRTHVSSDFPSLLADVTNKSLQRAYAERAQTFAPFTSSRTVSDFKTIQSTQFGDAPKLEKVNEKGEYKEGTISEGKETYKIEKFGKMISLSEELLINDDLGAFLALSSKMGRRARDLESDTVWAIINSNPLMGDGNALFSGAHSNVGTGAIDVANVTEGRVKMRAQLGLDGAKLDLRPVYIIVPSALETTAEQFLGNTTPNSDAQVNPFKQRLQIISEIRLDDQSAAQWYMFAAQDQLEMIEIARLRGQEAPSIETKNSFSNDCLLMKIKYHFAAKALDHRGFYRSSGV